MSDYLVKLAREALNGVTEGPWEEITPSDGIWSPRVFSGRRFISLVENSDLLRLENVSNARFIAAARDLVPAMVDRIEELEAKLKLADVLAHEVERRMVDLGGFDNRFTLRKALEAYRAPLKGQNDE